MLSFYILQVEKCQSNFAPSARTKSFLRDSKPNLLKGECFVVKVLEYVGRSTGQGSGKAGKVTFQYKRNANGIIIDKGLQQKPEDMLNIPSTDWSQLLAKLSKEGLLVMSEQASFNFPVLYQKIENQFSNICTQNKKRMQDFTPAIIAILYNEGSIELYHGPGGKGVGVSIVFRSDCN